MLSHVGFEPLYARNAFRNILADEGRMWDSRRTSLPTKLRPTSAVGRSSRNASKVSGVLLAVPHG